MTQTLQSPADAAASDADARVSFDHHAARLPTRNPFAAGGRHALFCRPDGDGDGLHVASEDPAALARARRVHGWLRERVNADVHPCLAARASFNQRAYRFGVYGRLATDDATAGLAHDLFTFTAEQRAVDSDYLSFIAVFDDDADAATTEPAFERRLWDQLSRLHALDRGRFGYDPAASPDPRDNDFAFSFAGHAHYVIGMHPGASRPARRFPRPALVFNLHAQFDRLRESGRYDRMRDLIRDRDRELHGSVNPMMADFGRKSEAKQYSGRVVDSDWRCPFHTP